MSAALELESSAVSRAGHAAPVRPDRAGRAPSQGRLPIAAFVVAPLQLCWRALLVIDRALAPLYRRGADRIGAQYHRLDHDQPNDREAWW